MKVSVICTNFNKGEWIREAVESFCQQKTTFPYEIIVVDDASTDESPALINKLAETYPNLIRPFFNKQNKGIAKTWIDICKEARGEYIARCDGDDYWIDPYKLQKQVDLLEQTPDSKWSNTDFDMVDAKGQTIHKDVLANRIIPFMDSFEKMLVYKGMTMASTWLVDTKLMLEVNKQIALDTADDTFNIQLELFKRTKLTFLPDSTTVYRMDDESDSRTQDFGKLERRFTKLLETQKEYSQTLSTDTAKKVIELLLQRNHEFELSLVKQEYPNSQLPNQFVTIYWSSDGRFSENHRLQYPLKKTDQLEFQIPEEATYLRLDLSELPSYYQYISLVDGEFCTELAPVSTNAIEIDGAYYFTEVDPYLIFRTDKFYGNHFRLSYQMFNVDSIFKEDFLVNRLVREYSQSKDKIKQLEHYQSDFVNLKRERDEFKRQVEELIVRYHSVIYSRRWIIPTKIINLFRRKK